MVQSKAESPPPEIITFLFLKKLGSLIIYSTPLPSNISKLLMFGFLGSKLPKPPAIATTFELCIVPLLVI